MGTLGSEPLVGLGRIKLDQGRLALEATLAITMSDFLHSSLTPGLSGLKVIFSEIQLD